MCIWAQTNIWTQANPQLNCPKVYLPTITKPTRITKSAAIIIDSINVKCKKLHNIMSCVINSHISDHLPVFVFTGNEIANKLEEPLKN